jgi:hypothetical protein
MSPYARPIFHPPFLLAYHTKLFFEEFIQLLQPKYSSGHLLSKTL